MFDLENFRNYVGGTSGQSYSSGLKRVESDLGVNIDFEYDKDKCKGLIGIAESKKKDNSISPLERKYWSDRCSHLRKYVDCYGTALSDEKAIQIKYNFDEIFGF